MSRRPRNSTGKSFFTWDGDTLVVKIHKQLRIQSPTRLPEVFRPAQEL